MKCPTDNTVLVISERNQIEIDYCPTCRGVWLDRGELDKMIEKYQVPVQPQSIAPQVHTQYDRDDDHDDRRSRGYENDRGKYPHKKKRESILSDLFDF